MMQVEVGNLGSPIYQILDQRRSDNFTLKPVISTHSCRQKTQESRVQGHELGSAAKVSRQSGNAGIGATDTSWDPALPGKRHLSQVRVRFYPGSESALSRVSILYGCVSTIEDVADSPIRDQF